MAKADPFKTLVPAVVGMIISQLSSCDTESLRRVSKHWKACSEEHNTGMALVRHFGHVGETLPDPRNPEEVNLAFRRRCKSWLSLQYFCTSTNFLLVYHEESLRAGRATSMFQCSGAHVWDTNDNHLAWGQDDYINIKDFQSGKHVRIDLKDICDESCEPQVFQLHLLNDGNLLVELNQRTLNRGDPLRPWHHQVRVVKLSETGRLLVQFLDVPQPPPYLYDVRPYRPSCTLRGSVCGDVFYCIEVQDQDPPGTAVAYLTAWSIINGRKVSRKTLPKKVLSLMTDDEHWRGFSLRVSASGTWALAKGSFGIEQKSLCILSIPAGEVLGEIPIHLVKQRCERSYNDNYIRVISNFPTRRGFETRFSVFNEETKAVETEKRMLCTEKSTIDRHMISFERDPDRKLIFRAIPIPTDYDSTLAENCFVVKIAISEYVCDRESGCDVEGNTSKIVTLPFLTTSTTPIGTGHIQRLEVNIATCDPRWTSFLKRSGRYIVIDDHYSDSLAVLSFWPPW